MHIFLPFAIDVCFLVACSITNGIWLIVTRFRKKKYILDGTTSIRNQNKYIPFAQTQFDFQRWTLTPNCVRFIVSSFHSLISIEEFSLRIQIRLQLAISTSEWREIVNESSSYEWWTEGMWWPPQPHTWGSCAGY